MFLITFSRLHLIFSKNWYIILKVVKLVKQDDEVTNNTNTTKIWFKQKNVIVIVTLL